MIHVTDFVLLFMFGFQNLLYIAIMDLIMYIDHLDHLTQGSYTQERMTSSFLEVRIGYIKYEIDHFFTYYFILPQ